MNSLTQWMYFDRTSWSSVQCCGMNGQPEKRRRNSVISCEIRNTVVSLMAGSMNTLFVVGIMSLSPIVISTQQQRTGQPIQLNNECFSVFCCSNIHDYCGRIYNGAFQFIYVICIRTYYTPRVAHCCLLSYFGPSSLQSHSMYYFPPLFIKSYRLFLFSIFGCRLIGI